MPKKIKEKEDKGVERTLTPSDSEGKKLEAPVATGIFDQPGELVIDVFETDGDFVVISAIAGVQIKDLDISLEKDMMIIKGNRCDPHENPDKKYFYQECYWGPFSRKIVLPENIDIDKADAQMDKGVLTIKIPKIESSNSGKIGIKVS